MAAHPLGHGMDPSSSSSSSSHAISDSFHSFYESFMGLNSHPEVPPSWAMHPPHQHQHQHQHLSQYDSTYPGMASSSSSRLTPLSSPAPSSLGMGIHPHPPSSIALRDGTLTPLTTAGSRSGSGSESGRLSHVAKKRRLDAGAVQPLALPPSQMASDTTLAMYEGGLPWPAHPAHLDELAFDPYAHPHPHQQYWFGGPYSSAGSVFLADELEYAEHQRYLQAHQGHPRRPKFIAQRRYRAGELVPVTAADAEHNLDKGASSRRRKGKQRQAPEEPPPRVCLIPRNVDLVASADLPPQAAMEVHTLFVRPPASVFEERERVALRNERLEKRKRAAGESGLVPSGLKQEDGDGQEGVGVGSRRRRALNASEGGGSKGRGRKAVAPKYGPMSAEWTFEYQDDFDVLKDSSDSGPGAVKPKNEVKSEEDAASPPPPKKRGRKPVLDAVKVALATGVPLHPWAAPLPGALQVKKAEDDNEDAPSSSAAAPATRTVVDCFGRRSEYPLPTPRPPYAKVLREAYRRFAAPGKPRIDMERMWRHKAKVWQAARVQQQHLQVKTEERVRSAPVFLRRNVRLGKRRRMRWDY